MDYYKLSNDEVILYHGTISMVSSGKEKRGRSNNTTYELLLTNLNFVFIIKTKQLLKKEQVDVEIYDVNTIKFYRDSPYIVQKKAVVELYFKECEKFIEFPKKKEAQTFVAKAMRVASGKSKLVRGVQKVQREINETNENLGIDTVEIAVKTAKVVLGVAADVGSYEDAGKKAKSLGRIAKSLIGRGEKKPKEITSKNEIEEQD